MKVDEPLCERLRRAFHDFKKVAAARARLELDTENSFRERTRQLEAEASEHSTRLEATYQEALTAAEKIWNEARTNSLALFEGDQTRAQQESDRAKRGAIRHYAQGKEQALTEFKESRWSVTTIYEAGRKVTKDQYAAAHARAKAAVHTLENQQEKALQLLQYWQFANDLPLLSTPGNTVNTPDPWDGLQKSAAQGTDFLNELQGLKLPSYVGGVKPYLVTGLVWLLASLPALLLKTPDMILWLGLTSATIIPAGFLIRWWLKSVAHAQAIYLWSGLCQAGAGCQVPPAALSRYRQAGLPGPKKREQAPQPESLEPGGQLLQALRQRTAPGTQPEDAASAGYLRSADEKTHGTARCRIGGC